MATSMDHVRANTPMGANLVAGGATFRVWAPAAREVHVVGDFNGWTTSQSSLLNRDPDGYWTGFVPGIRDRSLYKFRVVGLGASGDKRDPYARELEHTWPNPACIVRSPDFPWQDDEYRTPEFNNFVIYQLHVGAFFAPDWPRRAGTFLDVVRKIEYLGDLGVTCVQLLPIVEFQTCFSLGYNGTDYFSPEMDFGVPEADLGPYLSDINRMLEQKHKQAMSAADLQGAANQLKALVNLCHLYGLAVIFDVVYNHAGGEFGDESLYFFDRQESAPQNDKNKSLYFTDHGHAGGLVFALWKKEVRQFLIDNARFYLREYHVDGFRYDQVSVLVHENNGSGWAFCQDLTDTTRHEKPQAIDLAEYWSVDPWIIKGRGEGGAGFDTCLHDGLRISIRKAIGEASRGTGPVSMDEIAKNLWAHGFADPWRAVQGVENHDTVYRGREPRIPTLADSSNPRSWYARSRSRVALGLILTAPGIPMMFQGQEFLEDKPWSDYLEQHHDLLIYWDGLSRDRHMADFRRFVREAIAIRFAEPALRSNALNVFHVHNDNRVIAFHRWVPDVGRDIVVVASLNDSALHGYRIGFPQPGVWREAFNSDVYDHFVNSQVQGNGGSVHATAEPLHGFSYSAAITLPANSILVFAR